MMRNPKSRFRFGWSRVSALILVCMIIWCISHTLITGQTPLIQRQNVWSIAIRDVDSPLQLAETPMSEPTLTAANVTDADALFVADPFITRQMDQWYMFFEVFNRSTRQGDIAVARSTDGLDWKYDQIVLDEPFHLSYPCVIDWQEAVYMVPESEASGQVRLYKAAAFPYRWQLVKVLLGGRRMADPTLFLHDQVWWMFVGESHTHDRLRLYFADQPDGDWTEHPHSPIVTGNPNIARPGGRTFQLNDQLYRLGQDCDPQYGNQLRAFRIFRLTKTSYLEEAVSDPLLIPGSNGWNRAGMHHCDARQLPGGRWRCAVDGHVKRWFLNL